MKHWLRFWMTGGCLLLTSPICSAAVPSAPGLPVYAVMLEQGAKALAEGRSQEAASLLAAVADDRQAPGFARSLARFGLACQATEANDTTRTLAELRRLTEDETLPRFHREAARHLIAEQERLEKGMSPARDAAPRQVLPELAPPAVVFHVAPGATLAGDGSAERPFASLERAREAVRALKKAGHGNLPKGGVRVMIHGGEFRIENTFLLSAEDSGAPDAKVVYMANPGDQPILNGGVRVRGWGKLSNPELGRRLQPAARGLVVEANLLSLGVGEWGDATGLRRRPELFCRGVPQTLARWPDQGFVKTGEVLGREGVDTSPRATAFHYLEDRPSGWTEEPDLRLYGYWYWDWFEEYQKVAFIDPVARTIALAAPHSHYGYRKNQRYCALNVFAEIDQPGEWYLDRRTGMLYWLPPAGVDPNREIVTLSALAEPFIEITDAAHLILIGLTLQEGRNDAIRIRGGSECLIAGCTVRRCGGDGIVIEGGARHGVFGATIHTMGCGGMAVNGGSRTALTRGDHFVENCTVMDISRLKRTYAPAVLLDGCGNRIAHNRFERMPSSAIRIEGNDHVVELNRICHVVQESDDQGGLDMFGNPLYRGFLVRWNHWSDIGGGTHCGAAGVRLDDMISGVTIYGNVFERCGAALFGGIQIHGGKENLVDNNLFLDCFAAISFSRWGEKRWREATQGFSQQAQSPLFRSRYPELAALQQNADVNDVSRNLFVNCRSAFLRDGHVSRSVLNSSTTNRIDPAALSGERSVRRNPQLRRLLFDPIPFGEIGPYPHPWRAPARD